jgi:hypothetical protein
MRRAFSPKSHWNVRLCGRKDTAARGGLHLAAARAPARPDELPPHAVQGRLDRAAHLRLGGHVVARPQVRIFGRAPGLDGVEVRPAQDGPGGGAHEDGQDQRAQDAVHQRAPRSSGIWGARAPAITLRVRDDMGSEASSSGPAQT